ncbi:SH3 domain-containing protein [Yangia mangrovi]|uniref:SH3 domain-containing protein n=1 Tax=Alloyangia mangrovi TaxID=1779329 RepID=A0A2A3JV83_9RHOB|nr:SH3 domain-containing protein [Alloyangia mangrovi]MCT4371506.1 SH3 domain-containing protein [Alloyangia mangrovi]
MKSLMVMTFALLGWAWYSLSGGAEFEPGMHSVELPNLIAGGFATMAEARPVRDPAPTPEVTRASTASLADVTAPESATLVKGAISDDVIDVSLAAVPNQPISASFDPEGAVPATAAAADSTPVDLRRVTGTRVNLRYGPSTEYSVVGQLAEGDAVEILSDPGDGWVKLQAQGGGTAGWMYDAYLSAAN